MATSVCRSCGEPIRGRARYCPNCGESRPALVDELSYLNDLIDDPSGVESGIVLTRDGFARLIERVDRIEQSINRVYARLAVIDSTSPAPASSPVSAETRAPFVEAEAPAFPTGETSRVVPEPLPVVGASAAAPEPTTVPERLTPTPPFTRTATERRGRDPATAGPYRDSRY